MGILNRMKHKLGSRKSDSDTDINDIFMPDFLRGEAEFRYQTLKKERYEYGEKVRPGILADLLLDEDVSEHLTGMAVCSTAMFQLPVHAKTWYVDNYREISDFDVLSLLTHENEKGETLPVGGENLTLTLLRDNGLPIVMFFRNMQVTQDLLYIRTFLMVSGTNDADDKRAARQSENLPVLRSTMISCRISEADITEKLNFYESKEREASILLHYGKTVTDKLQKTILEGAYCQKTASDYLGYGDWLLWQERYYDAYRQYLRALKSLDNPADNFKYGNLYGPWNLNMAKSLIGIKDYVLAYHYMEVARFFNQNLDVERLRMLAKLGDFRTPIGLVPRFDKIDKDNSCVDIPNIYTTSTEKLKRQVDEDLPYLTIGFVLNNLLRVHKYNVSSLTVCKLVGGRYEFDFTDEQDKFWNMKIEDVMQDGNTIVLTYSRQYQECGLQHDKSMLCYHNSIIMHVNAITGTDLARVDIMIPAFVSDYDKMNPRGDFQPEGATFIIAMHPHKYDFSLSNSEIKEEAEKLNLSFRILEALKGFIHVFYDIQTRYFEAGDEEKQLFRETAGKIGYCYNEQEMPEVAEYYLDIALGSHNVNDTIEYINGLVNMKDVRAMTVIDKLLLQQIDSDENTINYLHSFLKRRKAYVLIDWGLLDEAKEFLQLIQKDPSCKDFATNELMWLAQNENNNK